MEFMWIVFILLKTIHDTFISFNLVSEILWCLSWLSSYLNLSLPNFCLSFGNAFYAMRTLSNVIAIQNSRQVYFAFI